MSDVKNMEGYDEAMQKFVASLDPEVRLNGLDPEHFVTRLTPNNGWLAWTPSSSSACSKPCAKSSMAGRPPDNPIQMVRSVTPVASESRACRAEATIRALLTASHCRGFRTE